MDADAKAHLLARRAIRVLLGDGLLCVDGALDRVHSAGEIRHHAVAGGIKNSAMMGDDQPVEDRPVRLKRPQGADFVHAHQTTVLGDVGRKDHRELSFDDLGVRHLALLRGAHTRADRSDHRTI